MPGYREHSFDPNAYEQPGKPLKPYNWVQWTGVAVACVGVLLTILFWLSELGWIAQDLGMLRTSFVLLLIGVTLINSRREPGTQITDEQRAKNRKMLVLVAGACALVLGVALVVQFSGSAS